MQAGLIGRLFFAAALVSGSASSLSCHHQGEDEPPRILFENQSDEQKPAPIPREIWVQLSPAAQRVLQTVKPDHLETINMAFCGKPPEVRLKTWNKMNGTSEHQYGWPIKIPFTVNHRNALINGRTYGVNTYKFLEERVNEDLAQGIVTKTEADEMRKHLHNLNEMKPWQRKAIFELLGVIAHHAKNQ